MTAPATPSGTTGSPATPVASTHRASDRARARIELWTRTFRTLYGDPSGEVIHYLPNDRDAVDIRPPSNRAQLVARPHTLRELLAPLVITGKMRPRMLNRDFQQLVIASVRDRLTPPRTFARALAALVAYGVTEMGVQPDGCADLEELDFQRLLAPGELLRIEPAVVEQRDGVAKSSRCVRLRMPFNDLRDRLNPKNWMDWGPFFEKVGAVETEHEDRPNDGWNGLFEELFVIDWNRFRFGSFHTFLNVDYTYDSDRVRTDYSLVYEVDHQFDQDSGYLEARRVPGQLGWCEYYAEKSVRQRNPPSSILAPMLAAVFLESGLTEIERAAIRHNTTMSRRTAKVAE